MSFLPLGRLGVTKVRRFGCYTTGYATHSRKHSLYVVCWL
jgi:hypothetical protein